MSTPLPPDPYKALGVLKDAKLAEIRSAHRKLVLKCHPDKVQDAALKAKAVDEFHKIQQAYEILSDDVKRVQYDERLKLEELRREMGRGMPHKQDPFEHQIRTDRGSDVNIRTAEFRPPTFTRAKTSQPAPKVYSHTPPRSYEDVPSHYEENRNGPRKTASYESTDRKHASVRDEKTRRREEDERERLRVEKDLKRSGYGKKEKTRDRERKRGTDDKYSRVLVESDSEDEPRRHETRSSVRKETRYRDEIREEPLRPHAPKAAPLAPKWASHQEEAAAYMLASKSRVKREVKREVPPTAPSVDDFHPQPLKRAPPLHRAETYAAGSTTYPVRHAHADEYISDDESPRRSSAARKESRKSAETSSRKEKSSKDRSRRSSPNSPYIVDDAPKKPSLQSYQSAPPVIPNSSAPREKPSRSQTQDYPRQDTVPHLPRAATFHGEHKRSDRSRERGGGTRLKQSHVATDSDSEAESPRQQTHRRSHSPVARSSPRVQEYSAATQHRYVYAEGKTQRVESRPHREDLRNLDDEYHSRGRESSPPGRRGSREERPAAARNQSSSQSQPVRGMPIRSATFSYAPESAPIIREARPAGPVRETSYRSSSRNTKPIYGEVQYAPNYGPENVTYSKTPVGIYGSSSRRTREPETYSSRDYYQPTRESRRSEVSY